MLKLTSYKLHSSFYFVTYTCSYAHTHTHMHTHTQIASAVLFGSIWSNKPVCPTCASPTNLHWYVCTSKCTPSMWFLINVNFLLSSTQPLTFWLSALWIIYDIKTFSRETPSWVFTTFIFKGWTHFLRKTQNQTKLWCRFYLIHFRGGGEALNLGLNSTY